MITPAQAAAKANVSTAAVYKAIAQGRLARVEIAGRVFVDEISLKDWMYGPRFKKSGRVKGAPK